MGYFLVKQPEPVHRWRVSFAAGVLRVSSKLGSSHRTLTAPVEAYAPPCVMNILPFWKGFESFSARCLWQLVSTLRPSGFAGQHAASLRSAASQHFSQVVS
jgi:hypothetical protein